MNRTEIKLPKSLMDAVEKDIREMRLGFRNVKITPEASALIMALCPRISCEGLRLLIKKHFGIEVSRSTVRDHIEKMKGNAK